MRHRKLAAGRYRLQAVPRAKGIRGKPATIAKTADPSDLAGGWCHYRSNTDQLNGGAVGALMEDFQRLGQSAGWVTVAGNAFDRSDKFLTARILTAARPCATPHRPGAQSLRKAS
jgi:hypothetical protein